MKTLVGAAEPSDDRPRQTVIPVGTSPVAAGLSLSWVPSYAKTITTSGMTANTTSVTLTIHTAPSFA